MGRIGRLSVVLGLESKKFEKGMKRSSDSLGRYKMHALAAVASTTLLAKSFLKAADTAQQYQLRIGLLLRSVDEGNKLFEDMRKFAATVPFELQHIMEAVTTLSGIMKGGRKEIQKWMPLIADLAAVAGMNMQTVMGQFVRMYSAGANTADMFRERGILTMLGFQTSVKITAEETRKHLWNEWAKTDSQFRGATKKLAKTWTGMTSMLKDAWFLMKLSIMRAGLFEYLIEKVKRLRDWMLKMQEVGKWQAIGRSLILYAETLERMLGYVEKMGVIFKTIAWPFSFLSKQMDKMAEAMSKWDIAREQSAIARMLQAGINPALAGEPQYLKEQKEAMLNLYKSLIYAERMSGLQSERAKDLRAEIRAQQFILDATEARYTAEKAISKEIKERPKRIAPYAFTGQGTMGRGQSRDVLGMRALSEARLESGEQYLVQGGVPGRVGLGGRPAISETATTAAQQQSAQLMMATNAALIGSINQVAMAWTGVGDAVKTVAVNISTTILDAFGQACIQAGIASNLFGAAFAAIKTLNPVAAFAAGAALLIAGGMMRGATSGFSGGGGGYVGGGGGGGTPPGGGSLASVIIIHSNGQVERGTGNPYEAMTRAGLNRQIVNLVREQERTGEL